ncbi:PD-(D/E)XK nuclease family protein [Cyanobacteria bacterium FACHB-63]|nr:PD-(D/E)XK nuclease family protein [Cyanobacteria bacterium FACHB-63]
MKLYKPFVSFALLSECVPAIAQEYWHCDMKRGFKRVRQREPEVAALLAQDTTVQRIGLLAQRAVYEFHHHPSALTQSDGVQTIASILNLQAEPSLVRERVQQILMNYQRSPILSGKEIVQLSRGDEGIPDAIEFAGQSAEFRLYAAIDCIFREPDGTLHILDFKTGKTDFDLRQAYVYLVALRKLYFNQRAVASFYNLETCYWSEPISATSAQLNAIQSNLERIAQQHDQERQHYRQDPGKFEQIFPPNSDLKRCQYCQFESLCNFSAVASEVSA